MLEQLMGLIQENSQEAVVKNPAIPNEKNNDVMQTLLGSITGGLQQEAQSGNISGIMGLLSGKAAQSGGSDLMSNPIVSGIANNAIGTIMEKFGLSSSSAAGLVSSVLPSVLSSFINKTSNPNDSSIDFNSILGSLMGGGASSGGGLASAISGLQGGGGGGFDFNQVGYALADGKLDMNDLMRIGGSLMGGGNAAPSKPESGGLDVGGLLGGLFGK